MRRVVNEMICTRSSKSQERAFSMRANVLNDSSIPKLRKRNHESQSAKDAAVKRRKCSEPPAATEKGNSGRKEASGAGSNSTRPTMTTRYSKKKIKEELDDDSAANGRASQPCDGSGPKTNCVTSELSGNKAGADSKSRVPVEDPSNEVVIKSEDMTEESTMELCVMKGKADASALLKIGKNPSAAHPFRSKQYLKNLPRRSFKMTLLQEIIVKSDQFVSRPEVFSRGSNTKGFFSCSATDDLFSFLAGDAEFFSYQQQELQFASVGLVRRSYASAFERRLSGFKAAVDKGGISGRTRRRRRERLVEALAACQSPAFPPDDEDTDPCGLTEEEEEEEPKKELEDKAEVSSRPWRSRRANGKQLLQWKFCYETASTETSSRRTKVRPRKEEKVKEEKKEKKTKDAMDAKDVKDAKNMKCEKDTKDSTSTSDAKTSICARLSPSSFSVNLPPGVSTKPAAAAKRPAGVPAHNLRSVLRSTVSRIVSNTVQMEFATRPLQALLSNVSTAELHGLLVATGDTPFVVLKVTKQEALEGQNSGLRYSVIVGLREETAKPPAKVKKTGEERQQTIKEEIELKSEKDSERKPKSMKEEKRQKMEKEEEKNNTEKEEKPEPEGRPEGTSAELLPESSPDGSQPKEALKAAPGRFLVKAMCLQPRSSRPCPYSESSDEEAEGTHLDPDVQERMEEMQQPIKSVVNSQGLRDAQRRIRHRKTDPDIHPVTRLYNSRLKACRKKETGAVAVAKILKRAVLLDRRRAPPPPTSDPRPSVSVSCVPFPPPKVQVDNRGRFVDPFRRDQHTPATALTASERLKLLKSSGGPEPAREISPPRSLGVVIEEVKEPSSTDSSDPSGEDATDLTPSLSPENADADYPSPSSVSESQRCNSMNETAVKIPRHLSSSIKVVTQPMQTFSNSPIKVIRPCTLNHHSMKIMNQIDSSHVHPPSSVEVINLSSSPTLSPDSSVREINQSPGSVKVTQSSRSVKVTEYSSPAAVTKSSSSVKVTESPNPVKVIEQSSNRVKLINQLSSRLKVIGQSSNRVKVISQSSSRVKVIGQSSNAVKKTASSPNPMKLIGQSSSRVKVIDQSPNPVKRVSQSPSPTKFIDQSSLKTINYSSDRVKIVDQSSSRIKVIGQSSSHVKVISRPMSSSDQVISPSKSNPVEGVNQSKPSIVKVISQATTSPVKMVNQSTTGSVKVMSQTTTGAVKVVNQSATGSVKVMSQATSGVKVVSQSATGSVKVMSQATTSGVKVVSQSTPGPVKVMSQSAMNPVKVVNQSTVSTGEVIDQPTLSSEPSTQNGESPTSGLTLSFATPPRVSRAISLIAGHHVANPIDAIRVPAVQVLSPAGVGVTSLPGTVRPLTSLPDAVPTALSARPLVRDKSAGFRRILPRPAIAAESEKSPPRAASVTISHPDVRQITAIQRRAPDAEEPKPGAPPERHVARLKAVLQHNTPPKVVKTGAGSPKLTAVNSVDSLRVPPASSYAAVPPSPKCNTEYAPSAIRINMTRVRRLDDDKTNESVKDN